jgi:hypothetical protein
MHDGLDFLKSADASEVSDLPASLKLNLAKVPAMCSPRIPACIAAARNPFRTYCLFTGVFKDARVGPDLRAVLFPCSPLFSLLALRVLTLRRSHGVGLDYGQMRVPVSW